MVKAPLQFVSVKGVDPCWVVMLPRLWASSPWFQIAFVVAADLGVMVEAVRLERQEGLFKLSQ
jgi:hypothetical protein